MKQDPYSTPESRDRRTIVKWPVVVLFLLTTGAILLAVVGVWQYSRLTMMAEQARMEAEVARTEAIEQQLINQALAEQMKSQRGQSSTADDGQIASEAATGNDAAEDND
jgi:Tfp pilus assembly protein FimT